HEEGVGAEVDVSLAPHQGGHDRIDLLVHERLAAGDRHHRRAALLHGVDALLDREPPAQDGIRMLDLAATGAGEVALIQRLELEDERELPTALEALAQHVRRDRHALPQGYCHVTAPPRYCLTRSPRDRALGAPRGRVGRWPPAPGSGTGADRDDS